MRLFVRVCLPVQLARDVRVPLTMAISLSVSLAIVVWWFVERHSSYAFVLQDMLGVCLCCSFLLQIRLQNIKVCRMLVELMTSCAHCIVVLQRVTCGSRRSLSCC